MLDHVFVTVRDLARSIAFYEAALQPLGIEHAVDTTARMAPTDIPISKVSAGMDAYFSGYGRARQTPELRISALSRGARPR